MSLSEDTGELRAGSAAEAPKRDRRPKFRLLTLEDLDRRTRAAQFARETRDNICSDIGGADRLSTLQCVLADSAAVMTAMLADLKIRWLQGENVDVGTIATLQNVFNRTAMMLGIEREPRDAPDLRSYLYTELPPSTEATRSPEAVADEALDDEEPQAEPAKLGDVVRILEGRALLQFSEVLSDKREKWLIFRPDGFLLEQHFSREAAEKRAGILVEKGVL